MRGLNGVLSLAVLGFALAGPVQASSRRTAAVHEQAHASRPAVHASRGSGPKTGLDHSGQVQKGRASVYAGKFNGRRMADGQAFSPASDAAASKTLPLGTTARVTNLENGKTTTVRVEDRGPYVPGRILDVSPKKAESLGIRKQGVAPVVVAPIAVPQPDGDVKLGAGAGQDVASGPQAR